MYKYNALQNKKEGVNYSLTAAVHSSCMIMIVFIKLLISIGI